MPGFNIRKHLKAYVKYNLNNGQKIVPGSLIFREKQPKDPGIWREVDTVKCCASGGRANCSGGGFWVDVIDREAGRYPISTCVGNDCSVYYFTQGESGDNQPHFLKFTSEGDLVWSSPYEHSQYSDPQSIKAIPDNSGAIAVKEDTLINLSAEDGSIVWHKSWGENEYVNLVGMTFNRAGEIILFAMDYDYLFFFVKLDPNTGTVITQKQIDFNDFLPNSYAESYTVPRIDTAGNIYVCGSYFYGDSSNAGSIVIKLDQNFDVIWSKYLNYAYDNRIGSGGFDIDAAGNSYVVDYNDTSLVKVNTNGEIDWAIHCQGTDTGIRFTLYCCAVSPEGDVYWVYNNSNTDWNTSGDSTNEITVFKFNTLGVLQWATAIAYAPGGIKETYFVGGFNGTNDPIEFKNGVLVICSNIPFPLYTNHLIKVSPTQTTGTFGDFIYQDITDKVTVVDETVTAVEFTLTTGLSTYFDVSNEKSTTFTLIENLTNVTTTPT